MPHLLTDITFDALEFLSVVDEGEGGDETNRPAIMLVKRRKSSQNVTARDTTQEHIELHVPVAKLNSEQRTVFGLASVITDDEGRPIVDHGDDVILASDLEKAVHAASLIGGAGKAGDMHLFKGVADVVESAVVTQEKREAFGGFLGDSKAEGWVVGLKVRDDDVWSDILKGRRPELSIKIRAKRTKIDDVTTLKRFKRWLGSITNKPKSKGLAEKAEQGQQPMPTLDELLAGLPEETRNAILAHIAEMKKETAEMKAEEGAAPDPTLKAEAENMQKPSDEETMKALAKLPDSVRDQIQKDRDAAEELAKANADLAKRVAKMEDDAELNRCIEKARKDFGHLPIGAVEFGGMYKSAKSAMATKDFDRWERLMKANSEAIAKGALFTEFGSGGDGDPGSPAGELDAAIKKVRGDDPTISVNEAKRRIYEADPGLYQRVRASEQ